MINIIKGLYFLLSIEHKKQFAFLQLLVAIMALTEVLSVISIGAFIALISDAEILTDDGILKTLFDYTGLSNPLDFVFWFGILNLFILILSALFSIMTTWKLALFSNNIGVEIGNNLYSYFTHQSWLYHTLHNSSELTKKIAFEADRMTMTIIVPLMQLNAKIVLAFFLVTLVFIYDPIVSVLGVLIFSIIYFFIYKVVRKKLSNNSLILSQSNALRYKLISEVFGGVKDVLLLGRQESFISRFKATGTTFAYSRGTNQALVHTPRYVVELLAFILIITSVLYFIRINENDLNNVLPILGVFGMAGFKLLPAFQQIYANVSTIKGNFSAYESIKDDLAESKFFYKGNGCRDKLTIKHDVIFNNVSFKYPNNDFLILNNINLNFPLNHTIGLIGASGSGKSTIVDLLSGLLKNCQGKILVDGKELVGNSVRAFQNNIGYVSQNTFLLDGTVSENIAFGLNEKDIDYNKVNEVIKLSNLSDFISNLENGIDTQVGERGVQISGGQKQRIGIARALYNDSDILIFDEATSALDGITEKIIMDAINEFSGQKTIILIAHRIKTVKGCDNIYFIDKGEVVDEGTYDELMSNNENFKKMVEYS